MVTPKAPNLHVLGFRHSISGFDERSQYQIECMYWYNQVILVPMKTAVSIPDKIFQAAERASKRLGISRSRLYALAIEKLLETERASRITEELNEVYAKEDSRLDPVWMAMQMTSLPPEDENW